MSEFTHSKMAYTRRSVSTLDSGIPLSAQINPYADKFVETFDVILYVPSPNSAFEFMSQFMAQSIPSVPITPEGGR